MKKKRSISPSASARATNGRTASRSNSCSGSSRTRCADSQRSAAKLRSAVPLQDELRRVTAAADGQQIVRTGQHLDELDPVDGAAEEVVEHRGEERVREVDVLRLAVVARRLRGLALALRARPRRD